MARSVSLGVQRKERTQPEWKLLKDPETGRHVGRFNPKTLVLYISWRGSELLYNLMEDTESDEKP